MHKWRGTLRHLQSPLVAAGGSREENIVNAGHLGAANDISNTLQMRCVYVCIQACMYESGSREENMYVCIHVSWRCQGHQKHPADEEVYMCMHTCMYENVSAANNTGNTLKTMYAFTCLLYVQYVCLYMYICMYIYTYMYKCTHIYVYIYTHMPPTTRVFF
jgi:hypothetical protein